MFVERLRAAGYRGGLLDIRTDDLGGPYDGILADAMLLHLTRGQFADVLRRIRQAVATEGFLAFTLKEGDGEKWSTAKIGPPRHFTYWRETAVRAELEKVRMESRVGRPRRRRTEPWLLVLAQAT